MCIILDKVSKWWDSIDYYFLPFKIAAGIFVVVIITNALEFTY